MAAHVGLEPTNAGVKFLCLTAWLMGYIMEQITGIEPVPSTWEAEVLPLNYICREERTAL